MRRVASIVSRSSVSGDSTDSGDQFSETGAILREFESQLQAEAEYFSDCASRADFKEGVTAFVEKREPVFTGN